MCGGGRGKATTRDAEIIKKAKCSGRARILSTPISGRFHLQAI